MQPVPVLLKSRIFVYQFKKCHHFYVKFAVSVTLSAFKCKNCFNIITQEFQEIFGRLIYNKTECGQVGDNAMMIKCSRVVQNSERLSSIVFY